MARNPWLPIASVASLLLHFTTGAPTTSTTTCHDYVLISSRGTTEPQGPSVGFVGMIATTLAAVPHGVEYDTVYIADNNLTHTAAGITDVVDYITAGLAACPDQKYALLGYSRGATINNYALYSFANPASAAYKAIVAVLAIGNPGHVPGASANVDQYGGTTTKWYPGWFYLGGTGAIPPQFYLDKKVIDICFQGDTVCEVPPGTVGGVSQPHLLYGFTPSVQEEGAKFLIKKLKK